MRHLCKLLAMTAASTACLMAAPVSAAVTLVGTFSGNDCGGKGGFSKCYATPNGTQQGAADPGSPAIIKFGSDGKVDISTNFSSITGSEFDISFTGGQTNTLAFTYTPGAGDPNIHYFSVKQANGFALFYDSDPITSGLIDLSEYFPNNPGYSHITFFNSGSTPAVPEPATWALMLLGFGAVGWGLRRRNSAEGQPRMRVLYN